MARILVVDDKKTILGMYRDMLSLEGHEVETASNGIEALEKLGENTFELVITDEEMPQMGGLELLEKSREQGLEMPFILVGGKVTDDRVSELENLGFYRALDKFECVNTLAETVNQALSR